MYLDLAQFVNPSSYAVQENMSLTKVYNLFRGLGLRHLCVVPRPQEILGVITRKDILPEHLEEQYPEVEMLSRSQSRLIGSAASSGFDDTYSRPGSISKTRKNLTRFLTRQE